MLSRSSKTQDYDRLVFTRGRYKHTCWLMYYSIYTVVGLELEGECVSPLCLCVCGVSLEDVMLLPGVRESSLWGLGAERGARATPPRER